MIERLNANWRSWQEESLRPFSIPLFRALWFAALAAHFGAAIQAVGASWTMTVLAPSPHMVALVSTAAMLPIVILALPAGALADTMDRGSLMLASQILGACAAATLAVLSFTNHVTPLVLLALTTAVGASVALHQPAWQASIGDLVPRTDVPAAVSLNVLAFNTARSVGPALGGLVLAVTSPSVAFLLNAVSCAGLIAVLTMRRLPRVERRHPPERIVAAMAAGLRFVSMSPQLKRIFLRGSTFGFGASALLSLLPLLARARLNGGPMAYGAMMGAVGLGSFVGALLAMRVRSTIGGNRILGLAIVVYSLVAFGVAYSRQLWLSIPLVAIAGLAWIFVLTTTRTAVQLCSPRWVVGRTVALGQVAGFGCMALGSAIWGAIGSAIGIPSALALSGAFLLVSVALHRIAPLPSIEEAEVTGSPAKIPAPRVAIDQDTGPVVISIEYTVRADDAKEFLTLMMELGRMRRRNGAAQWSLRQDIDNPDLWIEQIESQTWLDHVRRLDRYTAADRKLAAQVASLRAKAERAVQRTVIRRAGSSPLVERAEVGGSLASEHPP